jgi:hypothetical protein
MFYERDLAFRGEATFFASGTRANEVADSWQDRHFLKLAKTMNLFDVTSGILGSFGRFDVPESSQSI